MSIYRLPPGAWLSTAPFPGAAANPPPWNGAELNPPPWYSGPVLNPPPWYGSSQNPPPATGGARQNPPPASANSVGQISSPCPPPGSPQWTGLDPSWVYSGGGDAMLAQALRRVRTRIVQPLDPRSQPRGAEQVVAPVDTQSALWRWQTQFRLQAVMAELLSHLVAEESSVWWVPSPTEQMARKRVKPQLLFTLVVPDAAGFDYSTQIDKMLRAAVEREDRLPEILTQAQDLGVFFDAITGIDRSRLPRLKEVLDLAGDVTTTVLMAIKNHVAERRPVERSTQVIPVIATPGHGSLPSGHATAAALVSELLAALLEPVVPGRGEQLDRLARRIAFNRVVAGVHFPMDSLAGYKLGRQIAAVLIAAGQGGTLPAPVEHRVEPADRLDESHNALEQAAPGSTDVAMQAPLFALMWQSAAHELAQRLQVNSGKGR